MSWLKRFFGQEPAPEPEPEFNEGEYRIGLHVWPKGGDKFDIRVVVSQYNRGLFGESKNLDWNYDTAWDWKSSISALAQDKRDALEYAQAYIDNKTQYEEHSTYYMTKGVQDG